MRWVHHNLEVVDMGDTITTKLTTAKEGRKIPLEVDTHPINIEEEGTKTKTHK
jgi:hypothetical protein